VRAGLAEDPFLLRAGLARLLEAHDFEIAVAVKDAPGPLRALLEHRPDVAVVDAQLPLTFTDDGLRAARSCERSGPGKRFRAPPTPRGKALTCGFAGALGGTRTPSLLIRREIQPHPLPADTRDELARCCSAMRSRWQR
jgi:CheY-like chemotaxis protein